MGQIFVPILSIIWCLRKKKNYFLNHPPSAATVTTYFSIVSAAHLYLLFFSFNKVLVCIAACCGVPETAGGQNAWNSLFLLSVDTDPFFLYYYYFPFLFSYTEKKTGSSFCHGANESIQDMLRSIENRNRLMHLSQWDTVIWEWKVLSLKKEERKEKPRHFNDSTTDSRN